MRNPRREAERMAYIGLLVGTAFILLALGLMYSCEVVTADRIIKTYINIK